MIRQSGLQEATTRGFIFRKHPVVKPGDRIAVSFLMKEEKIKKEGKPLDWDKLVTKLLSIATTLALIRAYTN